MLTVYSLQNGRINRNSGTKRPASTMEVKHVLIQKPNYYTVLWLNSTIFKHLQFADHRIPYTERMNFAFVQSAFTPITITTSGATQLQAREGMNSASYANSVLCISLSLSSLPFCPFVHLSVDMIMTIKCCRAFQAPYLLPVHSALVPYAIRNRFTCFYILRVCVRKY